MAYVPIIDGLRTPAEDMQRKQRLRRLEGAGDEAVQVVSLAEHPHVCAARQVDLGERQHATPDLHVIPHNEAY